MKIKKDIKTDKKLKTILFSLAAASFDQFKNFFEQEDISLTHKQRNLN